MRSDNAKWEVRAIYVPAILLALALVVLLAII